MTQKVRNSRLPQLACAGDVEKRGRKSKQNKIAGEVKTPRMKGYIYPGVNSQRQ